MASEEVLSCFSQLVANCDCYFIMEVYTDEQEEEVKALLESTNLYQSGLDRIVSALVMSTDSTESIIFVHLSWESAHGEAIRGRHAHRQ